MIFEIKIPSPGESITEVEIANWFVEQGDIVEKDQEIAEIESDKATLTLVASESGKIDIIAPVEEAVAVGSIACKIDTSFGPELIPEKQEADQIHKKKGIEAEKQSKAVKKEGIPPQKQEQGSNNVKVTPLAKKLIDEHDVSVDDIINGLKKLTRKEVEKVLNEPSSDDAASEIQKNISNFSRTDNRSRMSSLRRKLSERLVSVKNETAMLTTFNEVDMSNVMGLRKKYKDKFQEKHGVRLGFMSFFTKAVSLALQQYPAVGAMIDGEDLITPKYTDIAIAVQGKKGLMVPVVRDVQKLSLANIEAQILDLATKARSNKLSIDEMTGGNFTITNGGVFGSLLSTPILNPPQSGILGMHNIVERPIAVDGQVAIRPMMYIALSYDHRVIDGATSVRFLVAVKELIEAPYKLLFGGKNPDETLLGL